jgi:hypothetical protein
VPLAAKSAATLLSLGADEIVMAPQSELGPLDAPIEHPLVEGIRLSALDGVRPIEFFSDFITRISFQTGVRLRNEVGLGRKDCLELALTQANQFCSPIVSKLDPLVVNMCYRSLTLAEKYGKELLLNYMLKDNPDKELLATTIINNLVWEYPEHGFVIDIDEAKRLNLVVRSSDRYDDWHNAWTLFLEYKNYNETIISFVERKETSADKTNKFKRKKR